MPALGEGQLFERYRIVQYLGSGVSGESYEAEDTMLLRKVTLKLIHPWFPLPDSARRQFFREMQGFSVLNHPYLATILDYGEVDSKLYVARRYVSSGSLLSANGRLWFSPPLRPTDAFFFTHQLAQALQYIHDNGYLHGALTFSNILVLRGPNTDNEPGYAPFLLSDIGLTNFVRRFGNPKLTMLPLTSAPEQLGKRVTEASDQFALATLLYFWLTTRPPFVGSPEEVEQQKLTETIPPLSSLNPAVTVEQDNIILRALTVFPEERHPSILAFADALLETLSNSPRTLPDTGPIYQRETRERPAFITPPETPREELQAETFQAVQNSIPTPPDTPAAPSEETPHTDSVDTTAPTQKQPIHPTLAEADEVSELPVYDRSTRPIPAITFPVEPQTPATSEHAASLQSDTPVKRSAPITQPIPAVHPSSPFANHTPELLTPTPDSLTESSVPVQPSNFAQEEQAYQLASLSQPVVPPTTEPAPQIQPDVPQPLPTPPTPEPVQPITPVPQPTQPTPPPSPQPEAPQPAPDPVPQPVPDVPQPLPAPAPQPQGMDAQSVTAMLAYLDDEQEELTAISPRFIITSPYRAIPYEFLLEQPEITIGRAGSSDLLLDQDNLTSRHHALLSREGNRYTILDRRSANGVYVNGQKIAPETACELADGDHISIGHYELIFRFIPASSVSQLI